MQAKCLAEALHMGVLRCRGSCDEDDDWEWGLSHFLSSVTPLRTQAVSLVGFQ